MPTPLYVLTVDRGAPFDAKATFYADHEEAMIGAVDAVLAEIQRSHIRKGHAVVGDFLEAAMRRQWRVAYEMIPEVRHALAMYNLPWIVVEKKHAIGKGETDEHALSTIANGLLSHFTVNP